MMQEVYLIPAREANQVKLQYFGGGNWDTEITFNKVVMVQGSFISHYLHNINIESNAEAQCNHTHARALHATYIKYMKTGNEKKKTQNSKNQMS